MIVRTDKVQRFVEKELYLRDSSARFTYANSIGGEDPIVFIDEEYSFQDTDLLAEDFDEAGAHDLADKLRKWAAAGAP
jgi:hypothetical protein